jgi:Ca2+-binding RTX toxin-like protein
MRNVIELLESRRLFSVTTMYTYAGDLNLDGTISGDDYGVIDNNFLIDFVNGGGWPAFSTQSEFSGSARRDVIVVTAATSGVGVNVSVNGKITNTSATKLKISGNGGNDKIHIDLGDAYASLLITIYGGDGDDAIVGGAAAERIIAGEGNDYVLGNGGRDTVYAEGGDDSVRGGGSSDLLDGGEGNDTVRGDAGNDRMAGAGGIDRLRGSVGNDTINGGPSKDFIGGEIGNDDLFGDGGADVLSGGENDDRLDGGAGNDNCSGDAGVDLLAGGSGVDSLFGGEGHDGCATLDDLNEHKDVDDADRASYAAIQGDLQRMYNYTAWDHPGLITSMPTTGVATGASILGIGRDDTGIFAGQTVTGATTIAMYTYAGDMNFDGLVDASDYGIIDNYFQLPGTTGYANGDFNYDGVVDAGDYGIIDTTLANQGALG